jgi:hypothetical protein
MSDYERNTILPTARVFEMADEIFTSRAGLKRTRANAHVVTFTGDEGTAAVEAHRHGPYTTVTIRTNQLRTSKLDIVARHLLNQLPYQPGDPEREY